MRTYSKLFIPLVLGLLAALGALFLIAATSPRHVLLYAGGALVAAGVAGTVAYFIYLSIRLRTVSLDLAQILTDAQADKLENFPIPVMTVLDNGEIMWCNKSCEKNVLMSGDVYGKNISEIFPGLTFQGGAPEQTGIALSYKCNKYSGFVARASHGDVAANMIYLIDDTELKNYKERYLRTRITVMLIMIDNYEELLQSARETERSQSLPSIEFAIQSYLKNYGALLCRIERDKFLVIVEESGMQEIIASRFSVLDEVRKIEVAPRVPATLSIGVGQQAGSLGEAENMARQALDMSLGRGGDQAAIKTQNGYEFYGGVSKGVEKRTKVKTRIVATALAELISSSSNVIIMGHRFADLDCIGSAAGLYRAVKILGKPVHICVDIERNMAKPLIEKLSTDSEYADAFKLPQELIDAQLKDTLLIVVDVHAKHFVESRDLYECCRSVVVIDHHRKMVDYIDKAVIFYHEPYASSASEMVSELVQYLGLSKNLTSLEAEALLAGIMLDTKNFMVRSGVRTFEAAAYLKRLGADTVEVRKFFSSPMENYQKKARIVSSATVYRRCAIAISQGMVEDIKLIAPQAADELLSISDVDASFVLFENGPSMEISSRSMGAVNVQLVMEKLGGGGHLNMAAAQFTDIDAEEAHRLLLSALDEYFDTLNKPKE